LIGCLPDARNATGSRLRQTLTEYVKACASPADLKAVAEAPADSDADQSASDLAKKLQNPIGDLISFPFQSNTNFNAGPNGGVQNVLNIQPVIPLHLNNEWNIITRTILPIVWNPDLSPAPSVPVGTGPTDFSAFLSPRELKNGWLWGVGPIVQIPTVSGPGMGSNVWGAGPTAVIVYSKGPWVTGVLANNVWSFGGTQGPLGNAYSNFLMQPFVNYNFGGGWYIGSAPIITANWDTSGRKWTVPVGTNAGRVFKIGSRAGTAPRSSPRTMRRKREQRGQATCRGCSTKGISQASSQLDPCGRCGRNVGRPIDGRP
jgi:hypothetical protein